MAIIPKIGGSSRGGLISGAASSLAGTVKQQISGVASREAAGAKPSNILGQISRVADLRTGGLVSAASSIFGAAGTADPLTGQVSSNPDQALNVSGLSQWGALSKHLFATLYPCDAKGVEKTGSNGASFAIAAPATDVQFESTLNWQSPFENSGPESKAPTIMAMIQTGQIATVANALQAVLPDGAAGDLARGIAGKTESWAKALEGRTGITKLNSRQVFSGMPPIRVTLVLHLRAVTDPELEVLQPYQQLLQWAWPQKLAENGVVSEMLTSGEGAIRAMFPSIAPQMVGFKFGNERYRPMVIESIANPLDGPKDSQGRPIYRSVQVTLATLTALDTNDVADIFSRS